MAVGIGASGSALGSGVLLAAILGVTVAAGLWWAYFDYVALAAECRLERAESHERATLARDSYSYLHLPMVTGIVLIALGIKKTLQHVGDRSPRSPRSLCVAASPCTCSATMPFGCANMVP